jgi:hypothetical protein
VPSTAGRWICSPLAALRAAAEAVLLAHGFTVDQLAGLVHARLATATAERVVMGRDSIEAARVRITEADARQPRDED